MEERKLTVRLQKLLDGLSVPMTICSPADVPEGSLSCALQGQNLVLCCPDDTPGAADLLRMAALLAGEVDRAEQRFDEKDGLCRILRGEASGIEAAGLAENTPLHDGAERTVLVFSMSSPRLGSACEQLRELIPMQPGDILLEVDRCTAALLRKPDPDETDEELIQFGEALQETLLAEAALQTMIGISDRFTGADALRTAYLQAREALEIGSRFMPGETVFAWRRLMLERFLNELPPEVCRRYHRMLFNAETARLFNEEMMTTIDMFFRKDLNLSDTARQLFIHRNTLVYRLDKVQKVTGLDLRTFKDALTFRLLMAINLCPGPQNE